MRIILYLIIIFTLCISPAKGISSCDYENCIKEQLRKYNLVEIPHQIVRYCRAKCTEYPFAKIEKEILINPEYNISFNLPNNWRLSENNPEKVNKEFENGLRMMVLFLYRDNQDLPESKILVQCKKYYIPVCSFINESFLKSLQGYLESEQQNFDLPFYNYHSQLLIKSNLCENNGRHNKDKSSFIQLSKKNIIDQRNTRKLHIKSIDFVYACEESLDSTCILGFELTSVESLFNRDVKIIEEMINSKKWVPTR